MQLPRAIERHRKPLLRIVMTLFAMAGLAEGVSVDRLPISIYRSVLRLLQPAESAVRRLVVVLSRDLALQPRGPRIAERKRVTGSRKACRRITFRLFDPRPRFRSAFAFERVRQRSFVKPVARLEPRIHVIDTGFDPRVPLFRQPLPVAPKALAPPPAPEGTVSAIRLCRRLAAIKLALEDLPRQARRYLRWQAKPAGQRRPDFSSALRRGHPPGHRRRPVHKVDAILSACHWLARQVPEPDTS